MAELFVTEQAHRQRHRTGSGSPRPSPPREWTTIVAGGPGTGKTHTVARILALLTGCTGPHLRVALAAPTGKAAADADRGGRRAGRALGLPTRWPLTTLHRLLGAGGAAAHPVPPRRGNRLPYDVVVVDETSMVSLTLMARLMAALRAGHRLVLVGDPDQLTSVDAGAVLADLVAGRSPRSESSCWQQMVGADLAAPAATEPALDDRSGRRCAAAWCA